MVALDALGNATRRQILDALRHRPMAVADIALLVPSITRPAVSRHLRLLREAQLVDYRRQGRTHVYVVRPEGFASVREYVAAFWQAAVPRYQRVAEGLQEP